MADEKKDEDLGIDEISSGDLEEVPAGACSKCGCTGCSTEPPAPVQPALQQG